MFGNGVSLADIGALLNGRGGNGYGCGDGFGGAWSIVWIVILFALFGWGNEGGGLFGGRCNNGGGSMGYGVPFGASFTDAAVQRGFDNQGVMNKLNGLENGLCSLGYDILGQTNGIGQAISQNGYQTREAISQLGFNMQGIANQNLIADMQRDFAMQQQLSDCCCQQRADTAQLRNDNTMNTCAITAAIGQAARDIIDNQNCGFRQVHDEQVALQMQAKDAQIASLTRALDKCDTQAVATAAVQSAVAQIRPPAGPAWIVPNPNANYGGNNPCCPNNFAFGF